MRLIGRRPSVICCWTKVTHIYINWRRLRASSFYMYDTRNWRNYEYYVKTDSFI